MTAALLIVAGVSLAVCVYVYFGYPALLFALGRLRPRPVRRSSARPTVSVVIPVHNEERVIEAKIQNTLALDYPSDRFEIVVVSDGSTDATESVVQRQGAERVRLVRLPRGGKALALNEGARQATGDVLLFTDADSRVEPQSLSRMVENFADPDVGGVCGSKRQRPPAAGDATAGGEGLYWRYEQWQKALESAVGSVYAADGTLYAVRCELFVPIRETALADDIAISTRVVQQGRRLVFEASAVAWEDAPADGVQEFARKVRVTNHSVLALLDLGRTLWTSGFYSVELLSHKLLRHLAPFFLLALLISTAALAVIRGGAFAVLLAAQAAFYALAAIGFAARGSRWGRLRVLSIPYYFCLVNAAALLGVLSIVRGRRLRAWSPRSGLRQEEVP